MALRRRLDSGLPGYLVIFLAHPGNMRRVRRLGFALTPGDVLYAPFSRGMAWHGVGPVMPCAPFAKERGSVSKRITSEESVLEQLRAKLHEVLQRARVEEVTLPLVGGGEAVGGRKRRRTAGEGGEDEDGEEGEDEGKDDESRRESSRDSEV